MELGGICMNNTLFHSLEGEKLKFKQMITKDSEVVHGFASDPDVSRFIGWPLTRSLEETKDYVEKMIRRDESGSHIYANIIDKSTNELIGTAMVFNFDEAAKHAEIGYVFHKDVWGRGFCTETVKLICDFAFNELGLHKLHAQVNAANIGSSRVLEKNGFELEGRLRDYHFVDGQYYDSLFYGKL